MKNIHYSIFKAILLLLSASLFANCSYAKPIELNDIEELDLSTLLEILEDQKAELNFSEVSSNTYNDRFLIPEKSKSIGFTQSAYWVRFRLSNSKNISQTLLLRQDYPLIDYVDFWFQDPNKVWQQTSTGDQRNFDQRDIQHRDFIFELTVPPNTTSTYYLRFESSGPLNIGLTLSKSRNLLERISVEQLFLGLYYGGFLVLLIYNFFLFIAVRDKAFAYYLLYAISYGLYFGVHNGLSFQFLWPNNPWWANQSLLVLLSLTLLFGLQFSRSFLNTKDTLPRLDKLAIFTQGLIILVLLGSFLLAYSVLILPASLLTILSTVLILIMGLLCMLSGYKPARYFMLAWTVLLIGVLVYMLKSFGLLPHSTFTQNGFQVGALIEMVLLSVALASRVSEIRKDTLTDTLTSLSNRRAFDEIIIKEFARANRYKQALSLLVIDIDEFKVFNDKHGHALGDAALKMVAGQLQKSLRTHDMVYRYGGEEFALILPGIELEQAKLFSERLLTAVASQDVNGNQITISIGAASLVGNSFENANQLFVAADTALYKAKTNGRNRVEVYVD